MTTVFRRFRWPWLGRVVATVCALGAWSTLLYVLHRVCARLPVAISVYSYRLVAQPVAATPRLPARRAARFTSRLLQPGDPALKALPSDRAVVKRRFAQGAECLALYRDDTLVGTLWFVVGAYLEDEVRCRFVPLPSGRCSWDFDVYVDPAFRMTGAFAALWDAADAELARRGVVASLSRISAFNPASLRGHASLGAVPVGRADFLCLGPLQVMRASCAPGLSVGWGPQAVPTLRVDAGPISVGAREVPAPSPAVSARHPVGGHPEG
ncbi:GNAT family N-acetyltransferase [Rhodovibrio salinarum]|uniref:N-acetyltransferase n=1 Tax=Rhodovibrio salinarum TaxID=1087 RepID=A0A934QG48_9PROT|nr:GNAT family N-acetyltransferase [Rhodovibrio salinarum]MBK1696017.1 N-acetyltransferase [Rhodovibrio salinarum]